MVVILDDLLRICQDTIGNKEIYLLIQYKRGNNNPIKIPMIRGHYIVDNTWFSTVCKNIKDIASEKAITNIDFIDELERECLDYRDDWGDLYTAPMEDLCACQLRFNYDIGENFNEDIFDIQKITYDKDGIYIHLFEK